MSKKLIIFVASLLLFALVVVAYPNTMINIAADHDRPYVTSINNNQVASEFDDPRSPLA